MLNLLCWAKNLHSSSDCLSLLLIRLCFYSPFCFVSFQFAPFCAFYLLLISTKFLRECLLCVQVRVCVYLCGGVYVHLSVFQVIYGNMKMHAKWQPLKCADEWCEKWFYCLWKCIHVVEELWQFHSSLLNKRHWPSLARNRIHTQRKWMRFNLSLFVISICLLFSSTVVVVAVFSSGVSFHAVLCCVVLSSKITSRIDLIN